MLKHLKYFIIALLLVTSIGQSSLQAQDFKKYEGDTSRAGIDAFIQDVRNYFDELLDVEIGWAALNARYISNVGYGLNNTIGLNRELRDTIEVLREILQSEIFVKSMLQYDHFWTRIVNRKQYSPSEEELEKHVGELYSRNLKFDIRFIPAWDTTIVDDVDIARKTGTGLTYTCKITVQGKGVFSAKISQSELETILNQSLGTNTYKKIKNEARPDVNQSVFDGLHWLAEKFHYTPFKDPSNIERVEFRAPTSKQHYGFDAYKPKLENNYETTSIKGKEYKVSWKSIAGIDEDLILAVVKKKDQSQPVSDTLKFTNDAGTPYSIQEKINDTLYLVKIKGEGIAGEKALLASYTYADSTGEKVTVTVGQANIVAYTLQNKKVVIVPLVEMPSGLSLRSIQDSLNSIYGQAATQWSVSIDPILKVDGINTAAIDDGGTGILSNYTSGMNDIIDAYKKKKGNIDKKTCYVFLGGTAKSGAGKCGFMPLKRQFGFIFLNSSCSGEIEHTIAHELGHGPFRLYHTFSDHNQYPQLRGSTNNLMDYTENPNSTETYKHQWDLIHDPATMLFAWAQDESEGAYEVAEEQRLKETLQKIGRNACAYCQRCDEAIPLDGALIYSINSKKYRCSFGKLKEDNTIESFDKDIKDKLIDDGESVAIDEIVIQQDITKFVILIKEEKQSVNTVICEANEDYGDYCNQEEPFSDETFTNKVIADIEKCANNENLYYYFSGTTSTFTSTKTENIDDFETSLQSQLNDETFTDVKFAVNIFSSTGEKRTIFTKGVSSEEQAELTLNYYIDNENSEVKVSIAAKDDYLQGYESKVSARASSKGYSDIDASSLRQQVLDDIHASIAFSTTRAEKEQTEPKEKAKECLRFWQVAQKNVKNVWDEGTMHKGVWHSNDPESLYDKFPVYSHFGPVITGAADEVIDEVAGIPLMIKTGYEIMSDDQKREALVQTFTSKEGLTSLWEGLKQELTGLLSDGERQTYTVSQVTTMVGFAVMTGGGNAAVKGASKGSDVLGKFASLANKFEGCPKLAKYFEDIKKLSKNIEADFTKLKELTDRFKPKELEDFLSKPGIVEVTKKLDNLHALTKNGLDKTFEQFRNAGGQYLEAASTLWKKTGDDVVNKFSSNGKYLVKHDKVTKQVLFIDIANGKSLGYFYDEFWDGSTYRKIIDNNYDEIASKLDKLYNGGTIDATLTIGKKISSTPGKTTTIIGSYAEDMSKIVDELGKLKHVDYGGKPGGFNVLNYPDHYWKSADQFWETFNKKFLDDAISRGDDIVLATNPMDFVKVFNSTNRLPEIKSIDDLAIQLSKTELSELKGFGKELKHLFEKGYTYDLTKNTFLK